MGYYTLVAAQVEHEQASANVRRGLSKHFPIPVTLIERLAVATPYQGAGLRRSLLLDALRRVLRASEELAIRAVTVDALNDNAVAFYRMFGFEPSPLSPEALMLSLKTVKRVLASHRQGAFGVRSWVPTDLKRAALHGCEAGEYRLRSVMTRR